MPTQACKHETPSSQDIWTVDEVAAYFRCSTRHVANLCKSGLPHFYLGRLVRFRRDEVLSFLQTHPRVALHRERQEIRARALGKEVRS